MTLATEQFPIRIAPILRHFNIPLPAAARICAAYGERWRSYHATPHPLGMLHVAMRLPLDIEDQSLLCLLVIYHDVWFKVGRERGENERMSAEWAISDLTSYSGDRERLFSLVRQGIEATIHHTLDGVEPQFVKIVSYLLDLDLWGLGQPQEGFHQDTEKVWHEFEPRLTRGEFDQGRSAWAAAFLERSRIYHNDPFNRFEEEARENLTALACR